MQNKLVDWISYNSYWRTFNRVLIRKGGDFSKQLEVNLTPSLSWEDESWRNVGVMALRLHTTPASTTDTICHTLPNYVYDDMAKHLGEDLAEFVMDSQVITGPEALITRRERLLWALLNKYIPSGGGVPMGVLRPDIDVIGETVNWDNSSFLNNFKDWTKKVTDIDLTRSKVNDLHRWLLRRDFDDGCMTREVDLGFRKATR